MAYSDFTTVNKATKAFNLEIIEQGLFFLQEAPPIQPSHLLSEILTENLPLAIATGTEKARSELLISPILVELRRNFQRKISLFSGESFDVDPSLGLNGVCDFLVGGSPVQSEIEEPVLVIVEAKKGDLKTGLGQCIAEMVAAQIFNESSNINAIYGVVTTGTLWRFLSLKKKEVFIDLVEYPLPPVDKILGILTIILNSFKLVDNNTVD
ncbi:hypothetical protein G7B40_015975 [Aetokthonos hydrillicola Thurmond2011]|jgi:hypothetical protein|uniref:Type I restriction enzyme R protein N-terminal domain-containing protein n=1 Tax=Aetokthonos hydrillicola Thurmond2011 TaxID=2712845 RepID=A0AAP5I734_9CYAN|nr:hypothetical protein [Aetokthonos hydrillicola]MBO3461903.1 hypothetical protein [Aetokthonos hydrillicola CCALA 1050]MBW4585432.1 hypothetical protein [Aetokthonos hydrillicola CCALA 1050]MDR9896051.1 hypothetical protein [Aetokthonos hydrillicola Thurmond2011]